MLQAGQFPADGVLARDNLTIHRCIAGKPKKTSNVASDKKLIQEGEDLPLSLSARWQLACLIHQGEICLREM